MHPRASALIRLLDLTPHPEGGYYREVFRSPRMVRPAESALERAAITTIYFLLVAGQHSRWHRMTSDEVWHYYEGDPLELIWLNAGRTFAQHRLLGPATNECQPVQIVPGGCWQAARPLGEYTLVGCSVAPGFEFTGFTLLADDPKEQALVRERFPELAELI
jgi:predicted cupin superfamily sugar epimerase